MDIERYWDGQRWTGRTRDVVSKLERIQVSSDDARARRDRAYSGRPQGRRGSRVVWWMAGIAVVVIGAAGYVGLLPSWVPWPTALARGVPEGPTVAYPVFGSDELELYLARSMVAQRGSIDVTFMHVDANDQGGQINDAMQAVITQNPYIFVGGYTLTTDTGVTSIKPDYTYDAAEAERRRAATSVAVDSLVAASGATSATSDAQAVTLLHDAIAGTARYDWDAYAAIGSDTSGPAVDASQEAYGIMVNGTAVCTGYAEAMLLAAHAVGVPAVIVTGEVQDGITSGGHAWNRVQVDGAWRVVDVTWDDATTPDGTEVLRHDYLLIPLSDPLLGTRVADTYWVADDKASLFE